MQFPFRVVLLLLSVFFLICLNCFWRSRTALELKREEAFLLRLAEMKTRLNRYEFAVKSLRTNLRLRSDALRGQNENPVINSNIIHLYNALPHLVESENPLVPAFSASQDSARSDVVLVIGVPTVKRLSQSYLAPTLKSLTESMSEDEKKETLIVVFVAEQDSDFVKETVNTVTNQFEHDVNSGLIKVISPHPSYYPDLKTIAPTLGDSQERTRWRTKQNLDYLYLMMYAEQKGAYYLQLEDDILTKKGFVTIVTNFALKMSVKQPKWLVLDFCQLGFIGKLFRTSDLWQFINFILLFYQDKPGDWLLSNFFNVKYCKLDDTHKKCIRQFSKHWIHYKPSIFQHIGMVSSLSGKVQKLKDHQFGRLKLFKPHDHNPRARIKSTIKQYGRYSLQRAYDGRGYFWGLTPKLNDTISFFFLSPVSLKSYTFVMGNAEHPSDIAEDSVVQVATVKNSQEYITIGRMKNGMIRNDFPKHLNPITAIRIVINLPSSASQNNWLIISEISLIELNKENGRIMMPNREQENVNANNV